LIFFDGWTVDKFGVGDSEFRRFSPAATFLEGSSSGPSSMSITSVTTFSSVS
jgi:hypothetical protein